MDSLRLRASTVADCDTILANVRAGFDSYVEWAPAGWTPPDAEAERPRTLELLADPATWGVIAETGGAVAGHVALTPARERSAGDAAGSWDARPRIPAMAHLWQLFVRPPWWGTGVAGALHEAFVAELAARDYERARLFTPSAHTRARRFYERRGWTAVAEEPNDELGLDLIECHLELRSPVR